MQCVMCHVVQRDSSVIKFDRTEIAFHLPLFDWLKSLGVCFSSQICRLKIYCEDTTNGLVLTIASVGGSISELYQFSRELYLSWGINYSVCFLEMQSNLVQ